MTWLVQLLAGLASQLAAYFATTALASIAKVSAYIAITLGLFTALLAGTYQLLGLITIQAPQGMGFIMSLIPQGIFLMINTWITALIMMRVYEYKATIINNMYLEMGKRRTR